MKKLMMSGILMNLGNLSDYFSTIFSPSWACELNPVMAEALVNGWFWTKIPVLLIYSFLLLGSHYFIKKRFNLLSDKITEYSFSIFFLIGATIFFHAAINNVMLWF